MRAQASRNDPSLDELYEPYRVQLCASGTAALAASLLAAVRHKPCSQPQVILPAYGCPSLVSAAAYAGVRPVLVDLEPNRPWLSRAELEAKINPATVAVVAVNLLGLRERLGDLRRRTHAAGALLIEDSAQALPDDADDCAGDYVVLSFGRGKPVSLLGGGAVLAADPGLAELLPACRSGQQRAFAAARFKALALIYNCLRWRWLYRLPQALPGLNLGQTRLHPLHEIESMDPARHAALAGNMAACAERGTAVRPRLAQMARVFHEQGMEDLAVACGGQDKRLLRYPLLCRDRQQRDGICDALEKAGLGASRLYGCSLPRVAGVEPLLVSKRVPQNAEDFAQRLLTLPVHSGVRAKDVDRMEFIMRRLLLDKPARRLASLAQ